MRKILAIVGLVLAAPVAATNFVYDNTSLPPTKSDLFPLPVGADSTKYLRASDFNSLKTALEDVRTVFNDQSTVNVKKYGALCTGSGDDRAAIQAAIDALTATNYGGAITFPAGTCAFSGTLTIPATKAIWLIGDGWGHNDTGNGGTVLKHSGSGNGLVIGDTSNDRGVDIRILGLRFQGSGSDSDAILIQRVHNMRVEQTRIWGWGGNAVELDRAYSNTFLFNYWNNNTGAAFKANQNADFQIIEGNRMLSNGYGVWFTTNSTPGTRIINNDMSGSHHEGIRIDVNSGTPSTSESVLIMGNYMENVQGENISLGEDGGTDWIDSVTIMNNQFNPGTVDAATNKIGLGRVRRPVIIGNAFDSCNLTVTSDTSGGILMGNTWNSSTFPTGGWARFDTSDAAITRIWGALPRIEMQSAGWVERGHLGMSYSGDVFEIGSNLKGLSATTGALYNNSVPGSLIRVSETKIEFFYATAGTNPRTLESLGSFATGAQQVVNAVSDCGMIGDDSFDNATLFQACLDRSYGRTLFIPKGIYRFTGPVTVQPLFGGTSALPIHIVGAGVDGNGGNGGTVLKLIGSGNGIEVVNSTALNADNDITMEGFSIIGDGTDASGGNGIHIVNTHNMVLRNLWVIGARSNGIFCNNCWGNNFDSLTLLNNRRDGIKIDGRANAITLSRLKTYGNGRKYDQQSANIHIMSTEGAGGESYGVRIEQSDFSYAGNGFVNFGVSSAWQASHAYTAGDVVKNDSGKTYTCVISGTSAGSGGPTGTGFNINDGTAQWNYTASFVQITAIHVASNVATITTGVAHGLSTGNLVAVSGESTAPNLNTLYYETITVDSSTQFHYTSSGVADSTTDTQYLDSTVRIKPSSAGLLATRVRGLVVDNGYCETPAGNCIYVGNSQAVTITGGFYLSGLVVLDSDVTGGVLSGMYVAGVDGGIFTNDGVNQSYDDTVYIESPARQRNTSYTRDGYHQSIVSSRATEGLTLNSHVTDGSSAIGFILNAPALSDPLAKLFEVQRNGSSRFYVGPSGDIVNTGDFYGGTIQMFGGTIRRPGDLGMTLSSTATATGSAYGFTLNVEHTLGAGDFLLQLQNNGGAVFKVGPSGDLVVSGDYYGANIQIVNGKIQNLPTGTSAVAGKGTCTLSSGVCTVSNTRVTAKSVIVATYNTPGGQVGSLAVKDSDISAGSSFKITSITPGGTSTNTSDTSTVNWWMVDTQ